MSESTKSKISNEWDLQHWKCKPHGNRQYQYIRIIKKNGVRKYNVAGKSKRIEKCNDQINIDIKRHKQQKWGYCLAGKRCGEYL